MHTLLVSLIETLSTPVETLKAANNPQCSVGWHRLSGLRIRMKPAVLGSLGVKVQGVAVLGCGVYNGLARA